MTDATNALLPCPYLTVVYKGIAAGEDAASLLTHPKVSAASWSHALDDRDAALEQANRRQPTASAAMVDNQFVERLWNALSPDDCPRLTRSKLREALRSASESKLNELFGNSEQLGDPGRLPPNLNELFGNSEKLPTGDSRADVSERVRAVKDSLTAETPDTGEQLHHP